MIKESIGVVMAMLLPLSVVQAESTQVEFPSGVVSLVVPFPAGSTTDNVARRLAEHIRERTKAIVVVENRAGADGNIAASYVLRQPADGHTLFITGNSVHGANANIYKKMPFDPIADFEPIAGVMTIPMILSVRPDFPASNVAQFIARAKTSAKPLIYASGNTSTRGAAELFSTQYQIKMDQVAYRGSPQVTTDLIGGQFDAAFIDANTISPFIKEGKVKGLAITSAKRLPSLPDIPTVAEGIPGFEFGAWVGVMVRTGTNQAIRAKLGSLVENFTNDPATHAYLGSIGSTPMPMNAEQLRSFIASETKTWAGIVKSANIERK